MTLGQSNTMILGHCDKATLWHYDTPMNILIISPVFSRLEVRRRWWSGGGTTWSETIVEGMFVLFQYWKQSESFNQAHRIIDFWTVIVVTKTNSLPGSAGKYSFRTLYTPHFERQKQTCFISFGKHRISIFEHSSNWLKVCGELWRL